METVRVNTSQHIDIDYPVAGLGERVGARLIDYFLFLALYFIAIITFVLFGSQTIELQPIVIIVIVCIYLFLFVFYDLLSEIFMNGQSFGKKLLKIKVVSLDGGQPTIGQYFIRWLFRIVDFTLSANLAGLICVAISDKKQRIGDIVAGTTLIKTKPSTQFHHIAFHPVAEDYTPVFNNVAMMSDKDIELVHEVLRTYNRTRNADLIYHMAAKVSDFLGATIPNGMNELQFLNTVVLDYNHETSRSI